MSDINELTKELQTIIGDTGTSVESRAVLITDDIANRYGDLVDSNPSFSQIVDMAAKIKASGATERENGVMWGEVVHLAHALANS